MLGAGINPESFKQDYSGFANAAAIQAQGIANLGKDIGNTIQNVSEIKKENKKIDAMNKAAAKSIEAAITLGNSYGIAGANETLSPFLAAANDPNLSAIEKAALLSEAKNMIPSVFGRFDKSQEMQLQQAQLAGRGSGSARPSNLKLDTIKEVINGQTYEVPVTFDPADGTTRRLDGSIVGSVPVAASIDEAANLPSPTSLDSAAAANMQPVAGLPQGGMDAEAPSVLPPLYTDDTSQLPPLQEIQPVPVGAKPEDINAALSISQPSVPPGAVPITGKTSVKFRPATEEESKPFGGLKGQIDESTGRFYPLQESSPKLKLELLKEASKLYSEGKKTEALQYATAAGIGGLFGNLTIDDLDSYFASEGNAATAENPAPAPLEVQPPAPTQEKPRTPLDRIFRIAPSK